MSWEVAVAASEVEVEERVIVVKGEHSRGKG